MFIWSVLFSQDSHNEWEGGWMDIKDFVSEYQPQNCTIQKIIVSQKYSFDLESVSVEENGENH